MSRGHKVMVCLKHGLASEHNMLHAAPGVLLIDIHVMLPDTMAFCAEQRIASTRESLSQYHSAANRVDRIRCICG